MDKRRSRLVQCSMYIVRSFISHLVLGGRFKSVVERGVSAMGARKRKHEATHRAPSWRAGAEQPLSGRRELPTYYVLP